MMISLITAIGGVGLFLISMLMLTEGLKGLAGRALRRVLARYTRTPVSGAMTGACATAVVQSSSATTVTTVGLVGAGLIAFPQGLSIIFGANIGTTITGWLVALFGFTLNLEVVILPGLLLGALLKMFGTGRTSHVGWVVAGFCLLILGIDTMQAGMAAFEGRITPEIFPDDTFMGRLMLVGIGMLITLVTQSSSAGVATAMVALSTGAISLPQGAAMVIGMDVGTTFTTALATVGGSLGMRRTGFAHVIYNVMTGILAFSLLIPFSILIDYFLANDLGTGGPQMALVAFHTFFNFLGVILVLPFTKQFTNLIIRLFPETDQSLTTSLDTRLLHSSSAAIDAAYVTTLAIRTRLMSLLKMQTSLQVKGYHYEVECREISRAISRLSTFIYDIPSPDDDESLRDRLISIMHILDHLKRLLHRCSQIERIDALSEDPWLRSLTINLHQGIIGTMQADDLGLIEKTYEDLGAEVQKERAGYRNKLVADAAHSPNIVYDILVRLDTVRWLQRVSYHMWRISHHISKADARVLSD